MIQTIEIKNFQGHKNTKLKLSKGINIIAGRSNNGKSAIIKALYWLINNRPSGFSFKPTFATNKDITSVSILTEENAQIARIRSKKENKYILTLNEETEHFKALGGQVPTEIQAVLKIKEYNIQTQFTPFFLLQGISAGEIAKQLNSICGLSIIDSCSEAIDSQIKNSTQKIKHIKEQKIKIESEIKTYAYLDSLEEQVVVLEKFEKKKESKEKQQQLLSSLIISLTNNEEEQKRINQVVQLEEKTNSILHCYFSLEETQNKIKQLQQKSKEYKKVKKQIQEGETNKEQEMYCLLILEKEEKYKNIKRKEKQISAIIISYQNKQEQIKQKTEYTLHEPLVTSVLHLFSTYKEKQQKIKALDVFSYAINKTKTQQQSKRKEVQELQTERVKALEKVEICEFCPVIDL